MRIVENFPFKIEIHDAVPIPVADGIHLVARIWRPVGSDKAPVPAILEFLPYRRRDNTAERDATMHPYFAGHGYACLRVDIRGSGDSEGVLKGEYLKQEQDDAIAILEWLERQPWCTGAVGMIGISWGGFNGLQVAARQPKQLKAVVSVCSTDDRYADDIHYMGGALLLDKFAWYSTMFSLNAAPPDPAVCGPKWRDMWNRRLDESGFWLTDWLGHQRRDEFYKHGSVCENYDAIQTPVLLVGGWADGYTNSIFRLLSNLKAPCRALIGPWAHKYPHFAKPGPQIGFLQECLRWWDRWLKDIETGVLDDPKLRAWMEDPIKPAPYNVEKPGRWVAEPRWPPAGRKQKTLPFSRGRLGKKGSDLLSISSPQSTGVAAGKWCAYGSWEDQPLDQRVEMGGQLIFDTDPLTDDMSVLGAPLADIAVSCSKPQGLIAVTLCEVFPDGAATRISYGILNLTHRKSHEEPQPLEPGQIYDIRVQLCDIGHRFAKGNHIRLAISNAYWPIAWPSPEANQLTVHCSGSALSLPLRTGNPIDTFVSVITEAQGTKPLPQTQIEPGHNHWTTVFNAMSGETILTRSNSDGWRRIDGIDLELGLQSEHKYTIKNDDPFSARLDTHYFRRYRRGPWSISCETKLTLRATQTDFLVDASLEAREGATVVKAQKWSLKIPRDCV